MAADDEKHRRGVAPAQWFPEAEWLHRNARMYVISKWPEQYLDGVRLVKGEALAVLVSNYAEVNKLTILEELIYEAMQQRP